MGSDAAAMAALGKSVIPAHVGVSNGFVNTSLCFQAILDKFLSHDLLFPMMVGGKIKAEMFTRPAQPKSKFLSLI